MSYLFSFVTAVFTIKKTPALLPYSCFFLNKTVQIDFAVTLWCFSSLNWWREKSVLCRGHVQPSLLLGHWVPETKLTRELVFPYGVLSALSCPITEDSFSCRENLYLSFFCFPDPWNSDAGQWPFFPCIMPGYLGDLVRTPVLRERT